VKVDPDLDFIEEISSAGGDTLKKCYQCASCSVVCELAPNDRPFPRKEMIWASWGLKNKLVGDVDVWLCHQCGDCSEICPRGAKPGDTLAAIRNYMFKTMTFPKFLGTWLSSPKYLPLVLAVPIILLALACDLSLIPEALARGRVDGSTISFEEHFLPHSHIYYVFITATHLAALFLAISLVKFWKLLSADASAANSGGPTQGNLITSAIAAVKEIATHAKFKQCEQNNYRYLGHLGIMWGFILLAIGTAIEIAMIYGSLILYGEKLHLPLHQLSLPKLFGHAGIILLLIGLVIVIKERLNADPAKRTNTYQDWYLLVVLLGVGVTGQLLEIIRVAGYEGLSYIAYFIHLVLIFLLIGYFPYTKFAHIFYRFVAILHSKYSGRDATVDAAAA
jgi:quinone-modifying oxidoreductase subunit QmoC